MKQFSKSVNSWLSYCKKSDNTIFKHSYISLLQFFHTWSIVNWHTSQTTAGSYPVNSQLTHITNHCWIIPGQQSTHTHHKPLLDHTRSIVNSHTSQTTAGSYPVNSQLTHITNMLDTVAMLILCHHHSTEIHLTRVVHFSDEAETVECQPS